MPLQVGASTVAFPRAAAAAAWTYLLGGGLLVAAYAIHGGPDGTDARGNALFVSAFVLVLLALLIAWICIATTVVTLRTTGMRLTRVPLFAWSALVAGSVWVLTLPVLIGLAVLSYLDVRYQGILGVERGLGLRPDRVGLRHAGGLRDGDPRAGVRRFGHPGLLPDAPPTAPTGPRASSERSAR